MTLSGVVELMLEQNTELETERAVGDGNRARGSKAKDVFWIIENYESYNRDYLKRLGCDRATT